MKPRLITGVLLFYYILSNFAQPFTILATLRQINKYITSELDLEQLIDGCKNQQTQAQKELFLRYRDALYTTSLKYCRNQTEAQDNVHDAFVIIFETVKKYKGKGSFEGWMQRIVINQAVKKFRQKTKEVLSDEPLGSTAAVSQDSEASKPKLANILKAIQSLPDRYRLVFSLYHLDDYSHQEIAQLLGISTGTSKSNLHRAKALLKEKLSMPRQVVKS